MSKINVLSLFDGLAGAKLALDRLNIPCNYYASEIDKYAIKIALKNFPDIIQLGDIKQLRAVKKLEHYALSKFDLLIGGSPCQDLSISKKNRQGLQGERSSLFFEYVRLLEETKPKYFLLENVNSMSKENKQIITDILGIEPIMINSALLTAQNRKRLYWFGKLVNNKYKKVEVKQPEDKGIYLKDILEKDVDEYFNITNYLLNVKPNTSAFRNSHGNIKNINQKSNCLSASGQNKANASCTNLKINDNFFRRLTPSECERLQGISDNYTEGVSNTQRYKMIGNGFTVNVIKHILSYMDLK